MNYRKEKETRYQYKEFFTNQMRDQKNEDVKINRTTANFGKRVAHMQGKRNKATHFDSQEPGMTGIGMGEEAEGDLGEGVHD